MNYKQIKDEDFLRGKVPMTKSEVRTLSIIKMQIEENDIIWDIGAGTGSISVEAAVNFPNSKIYAIERNSDGIHLIKENINKFNIKNIIPVQGLAPEVFENLEVPNKIIIGGSGGNLEDILEYLWSLKSVKNIVLNAVTINTAYAGINYFNKKNADFESIQINISNIEIIKEYQMLRGQNPIFIISAKKQEER
jgi:precorrin-6Y C5,15-methyltransferase (decarboxylating) CbiT subunit